MTFCDCTDGPPWPTMMRIHTNTPSRYYVCRRCASVREDYCRPDGTITGTKLHHLESVSLPAAVVEQVREILSQPRYEQRSLFDTS